MVEAGGEFLDVGCLAVCAYATENDDGSGAGVGEKEVTIRSGANEAGHGEGTAAELHAFFVFRALHGLGISAGVEGHLETCRSDGPCVLRFDDEMRRVVDGLGGVWRGEIGGGDLAAHSRLLLVPVGEGCLTGDGFLIRLSDKCDG
jgi:hypothetical protein